MPATRPRMMSHRLVLSVAIFAVAALLAPGAAGYPWQDCGDDQFAAGSKYLANINLLAASLPKNASASPDLFATAEAGAAPDKVWALALCRGDANATSCLSCLAQAFRDLPNVCDYSKVATMYYDSCTLHYSNASRDPAPVAARTYRYWESTNVTSEQAQFNSLVARLVNATADYAAYNSTRRYASGEADFNREFPKIYSWAQCTPDLTSSQCRQCLAKNMVLLPQLFVDSTGARALQVSCSFRYQTYSFFDGPVMVRLPAPSPSTQAPAPAPAPVAVPTGLTPATASTQGRKYSVPSMVLIILLPVVAAINLVACFFFWRRKRPLAKTKQSDPSYFADEEDNGSVDSMLIDISTLRVATWDFADSNKLGDGGFGAVYKGILPDGDEIAVKRLSKSSTQGVEELKNELSLVAKLRHKNLVTLLGVCLEQQERLLVYEFVPNRSLDLFLFDAKKHVELDWEKRYKIINGIARGLQYLHEDSQLRVVHRDLKASNILLDKEMNPKISDFGIARLFGQDQTHGITKHVVGTYGYMAPEYVMRGNYSVKSDSFSFGVMVLEIVTGRKNNDYNNSEKSQDLLNVIWDHWMATTVLDMMDPCMNTSFSESGLLRCIHIGLLCVQENPADRPLMSSVVMMLGSDTVPLSAPSKPAFYAKKSSDNFGITST
ncbi:cysteine-rich receptor-like protein kinase 6 [Triticum dicoccoides]|uniref:cysteine-rich receptor-like protein kinase 6 n=1 Tax=Triticum dicoccoides TaxID=85692 RepID=UPI00188F966F|nr:cysteine-rich receptor-like protein kinase 6 [Triticum dicoccoides]